MPATQKASYASPAEALRAAVDLIGSQAAMARLLGLSQPSVWRWLHKGQVLPAEHVLAVEAATGVSKYDLRPDLFRREALATHAPLSDMAPAR